MDVEMDIGKTVARLERNGRRLTLVLTDGTVTVRMPVPAETQDEPYPYQSVSSVGWKVVHLSTDVRRMSLLHTLASAT